MASFLLEQSCTVQPYFIIFAINKTLFIIMIDRFLRFQYSSSCCTHFIQNPFSNHDGRVGGKKESIDSDCIYFLVFYLFRPTSTYCTSDCSVVITQHPKNKHICHIFI